MLDHGASRDQRAAAARFPLFSACRRSRPAIDAFLGVPYCVMSCSMFVSLVQSTARGTASMSEFASLLCAQTFPK
jgi:hypothetical protein